MGIHGQHAHQALLSRSHQLALLDAYAGHAGLTDQVRRLAEKWRHLRQQITDLMGVEKRQQHLELLRHECHELEQWVLPAAQLSDLENTHQRLAHADQIAAGIATIINLLDGDNGFTPHQSLSRSQQELRSLVELDTQLAPLQELLDTVSIQLGETMTVLNRYAQNIEQDPERLKQVDEHLARLHELSRRHHQPAAQLNIRLAELQRELEHLEATDRHLAQLTLEQQQTHTAYLDAAKSLTHSRQHAATALNHQITALMRALGMRDGLLKIQFDQTSDDVPSPLGREHCEWLVSINPGQGLRALRKVASGGELARISLAIEVATLGQKHIGCMVFDEVDSGIGGAVAAGVGQKLRTLGSRQQVLCITHLPQVAAHGHAHLRVSKKSSKDATHLCIETLDQAGRCTELARMLGSVEITPETRAHAKKMLEQGQSV